MRWFSYTPNLLSDLFSESVHSNLSGGVAQNVKLDYANRILVYLDGGSQMTAPLRKEEFAHDVTVEWLDDDQIVIFSALQPTRAALDMWVEKVIEVTDVAPYKVRYIHDFSKALFVLTPYGREAAKRVNEAHPDATGYAGILLHRSILSSAIRFFLNHDLVKRQPNLTSRVFFTREEALTWLRQFPVEEPE